MKTFPWFVVRWRPVSRRKPDLPEPPHRRCHQAVRPRQQVPVLLMPDNFADSASSRWPPLGTALMASSTPDPISAFQYETKRKPIQGWIRDHPRRGVQTGGAIELGRFVGTGWRRHSCPCPRQRAAVHTPSCTTEILSAGMPRPSCPRTNSSTAMKCAARAYFQPETISSAHREGHSAGDDCRRRPSA